VCVRTRPFRIVIHKLIDAADNIADVSRISIRLRENDESHIIAKTIQKHFLCGSVVSSVIINYLNIYCVA